MRMSTFFRSGLIALFVMFLLGSASGHAEFVRALSDLNAMDTAFTYQGRLVKDGEPVDGVCDLRFTLMDATHGHIIGLPLSLDTVPVSNGLFTVELDFGAGIWCSDSVLHSA